MNWVQRKVHLYNVTFGLYMLDWWERCTFNILVIVLMCFVVRYITQFVKSFILVFILISILRSWFPLILFSSNCILWTLFNYVAY